MDLNMTDLRALRALDKADAWTRQRDLYRAILQRLPVPERHATLERLVSSKLVERREVLATNGRGMLELRLAPKGRSELTKRRKAGVVA